MKLARFTYQDTIWLGLVDVGAGTIDCLVKQQGDEDLVIRFINASQEGHRAQTAQVTLPISDVQLLPPIETPSKNIICIGKNYVDHAYEFAASGYDTSVKDQGEVVPDALIVFSKAAGTMIGAFDDINPPWALSKQIDYEAELAVVIGRRGRNIARKDAYDHIWGYTVINDVSARDLQSRHRQWFLGKSIDTFCPIGPWLVSADEVDPSNLEVSCWVNGELRQHANTRDLIFDIPTILSTLSASMTLCVGDIIATGTPAGVGVGYNPPRFLKPGDTVRIAIESIGEIENTLR